MEVVGKKKRKEGKKKQIKKLVLLWTLLSNVSPRFVPDLYPRNTHIAHKTCNVHMYGETPNPIWSIRTRPGWTRLAIACALAPYLSSR
jgi:hypothetical protein